MGINKIVMQKTIKNGEVLKRVMEYFCKGKNRFPKIDEKSSFTRQKQYQFFPNSEKIKY